MDISMENNEPSPESETDILELFFRDREEPRAAGASSVNLDENPGALMPPPPGPPSAIPSYLAQSLASFSFISPSKEGEVPMEFSPGVKKHFEKGIAKDSQKAHESSTSPKCMKSVNKKESPEYEDQNLDANGCQENASGPEMHPADVFTKSPGSPSSEFKAMLDAIDVKESSSGDGEEDFLKRQEKPNMRRCRSLEMRKRLFDMSNTPPNAFKSVFKRPATADHDEQNYTKLAKRPRDLTLGSIKETGAGSVERLCATTRDVPQASAAASSRDSEDHERIKVAVDALQSPEMIGDCSRQHSLPVINGKHSDLKNINHETLALHLSHGSQGKFDNMTIIDCRYPYEYDGGHIMNAVNFYTEEQIDKFLQKELLEVTGRKPQTHILIFHCEFSSQRGPGLLRYLRKKDRQMNIHQYPLLTFPEMYVLHLGYKEFFHNHPHLCIPPAYVPMADESYVNDLKHFRAKAKSWTAGERTRSSKR